jgi:hypothetical protein
VEPYVYSIAPGTRRTYSMYKIRGFSLHTYLAGFLPSAHGLINVETGAIVIFKPPQNTWFFVLFVGL